VKHGPVYEAIGPAVIKLNKVGFMLKGNIGRLIAQFLIAISLFADAWAQVPQPTLPQPAVPQTTPSAPQGQHELTPADLDAFFDGLIPLQIQRDDIAGAVVIVVKDGNVLFARGYGYADADRKKPVSVDDTLFRPGSV
jgi:CubicO group peptidase (beta-lactamase class C family)